jgi:hypothetical protein
VPTNRITKIIRGKRGISGVTALRLGRWFGTEPDIWMNLQKSTNCGGQSRKSARPWKKSRRIMAVPRRAKICRFLRPEVQRARGQGAGGRQAGFISVLKSSLKLVAPASRLCLYAAAT